MNTKKTAYIYLPAMVITVFIVMYFSGIKWVQEIICPSVDWELGLVENLQLVLLLMIFGVSVIAIFRKDYKLEKVAFLLLALFTLFVFLEEMDYGNHFLKYFEGKEDTIFSDLTGHANIHNEGNNAKLFKRSIYPLMGILFILAPLVKGKINNRFLAYLIPDRYIIATAVITILSYLVPRLLVDFNVLKDGGFGVNIGEFSEIMIYYIFFLYLYEIIFKKTYIK